MKAFEAVLAGDGLEGFRSLLAELPAVDTTSISAAAARDSELTKPPGALGRLEDIAVWLAGWQGTPTPAVQKPAIAVFAGNHGVTRRGVSPYPSDVTAQMVANFSTGGAAINQICEAGDIHLSIHPVSLDTPTADFTVEAAMTAADCAAHIADGMAAVVPDCDLFGAGEMGIGNTTSAAAIYTALFKQEAARFVGRGTGVDDAGLRRKISVVEAALAQHAGHLDDPLEVLRRLGGREIAAIAGAILAARLRRIPVVLDGYVVTAAAAVLHALDAQALDHCVAGHCSAEGAHAEVLERLGLQPILSLGLRLGEGTGAALAMSVIKAAAACQSGMATFSSAGVANR